MAEKTNNINTSGTPAAMPVAPVSSSDNADAGKGAIYTADPALTGGTDTARYVYVDDPTVTTKG